MVFLNVAPSFPNSPTVADAATTLWIAIMLPAAAPTAWSATIIALETDRRTATSCWKAANIRLLTVFEPAMNAPNAPVRPANNGQIPPTVVATQSAIARGIEAKPESLIPEFI